MTRKSGKHQHWTAVSTLLGLISNAHRDLHHWRSNQQPQYAEAETLPLGHRFTLHVSDAELTIHGKLRDHLKYIYVCVCFMIKKKLHLLLWFYSSQFLHTTSKEWFLLKLEWQHVFATFQDTSKYFHRLQRRCGLVSLIPSPNLQVLVSLLKVFVDCSRGSDYNYHFYATQYFNLSGKLQVLFSLSFILSGTKRSTCWYISFLWIKIKSGLPASVGWFDIKIVENFASYPTG